MDEKPLFSTRWYDIINDDGMLVVKQKEFDAPEEAPAIDIESNDIVSITYGVQYFVDIEELKEFEKLVGEAISEANEIEQWLHSDEAKTASVKKASDWEDVGGWFEKRTLKGYMQVWHESDFDEDYYAADVVFADGQQMHISNAGDTLEEAEATAEDALLNENVTAAKFAEPEDVPEYSGTNGEFDHDPIRQGSAKTADWCEYEARDMKKSIYDQPDVLACDDDVTACDTDMKTRSPEDAVLHKHAGKTAAAVTDVYYEPIEARDVLEESSEDGKPLRKFYDVIDVKKGLVVVEDEDGGKQMLSQTDIDDRGLFKNAEASDEARKERGEYTDEELQSFQDEEDYDAWRDRDI